jgi:hypothetical protein
MGEAPRHPTHGHLPPDWEKRLLALLLCPFDVERFKFLNAWAQAEGGHAVWNPLNTTFVQEPCTDYNSAGVKNYDTPVAGVAATARTLILEPYRCLWRDLQFGSWTALQLATRNSVDLDVWGTGGKNVIRILS